MNGWCEQQKRGTATPCPYSTNVGYLGGSLGRRWFRRATGEHRHRIRREGEVEASDLAIVDLQLPDASERRDTQIAERVERDVANPVDHIAIHVKTDRLDAEVPIGKRLLPAANAFRRVVHAA